MRSPVVAPVPWGAIWLAVAYPFPHGNRVPWLQGFPLDMSLSKFMTRFNLDSGRSPATFSRTQRRSRRRKPVDFPPFAFFRVFSGPKTISLICLDHWLEANATWHRHPADVLSPFIWQRWYESLEINQGSNLACSLGLWRRWLSPVHPGSLLRRVSVTECLGSAPSSRLARGQNSCAIVPPLFFYSSLLLRACHRKGGLCDIFV